MGVHAEAIYTVVCDRCGVRRKIDEDPRQTDFSESFGWAWYNRVGPEGPWGTEQILLCTGCVSLLKLFFQGHLTAAGRAFNERESCREGNALEAIRTAEDQERYAPWND